MFPLKFVITSALVILIMTGCADISSTSTEGKPDQDMTEIEYGRKLVLIMGCNDCHTADAIGGSYGPEEDWLVGGTRGFYGPYGTLYPANLRLLISSISEREWVVLAQRMRTNSPMAWSRLPLLTVDDLKAIYRFIKYLGPKGEPAPPSLPPGVKPDTEFIRFPLPH